jgi:hypothetical protein
MESEGFKGQIAGLGTIGYKVFDCSITYLLESSKFCFGFMQHGKIGVCVLP